MICIVYGRVRRSGDNSAQAFVLCQGLDSGNHLYLLSQLIGPSSAFLCMLLKGLLEAPLPFLDIRSAPTSKELFSASFPLKLQAQVAASMWHGWKGSWAVGEPQCALTMPEGPGFWGTSQTKQNLGEWWELRVSL